MQIDKWIVDEQSGEHSRHTNNAKLSVWIDPVGPQHMSASYLPSEKGPQDEPAEQSSHFNQSNAIPARSSAHKAEVVMVRPRYPHSYTLAEDSDVTRIPTRPQPTIWQYESPEYAAESSLSSLSLVVPELAAKDNERRYVTPNPDIDIAEIETIPPVKHTMGGPKKTKQLRIKSIDELDTVPPHAPTVSIPLFERPKAVPVVRPPATVDNGANSWTVGAGANSVFARRIASKERNPRRITPRLNPLDKIRWWLLYPGRIEFLLWFSGTVTLMTVTCIFLFVTVISFGWMTAGSSASVNGLTSPTSASTVGATSCPAKNKQCHTSKAPAKIDLSLKQLTADPLIEGLSVTIQGEGFSTNGLVKFTHDNNGACNPDSIKADGHGVFIVPFQLGIGPNWAPGTHTLTAYDNVSKHSTQIPLLITTSPFGKSGTPVPVTASGASPTPGSNGGGNGGGGQNPNPHPTPVSQAPATPTPGTQASPTPVPTQSAPTPTPTTAPKPSPTTAPSPKPTPGVTPTAGTKKVISSTANGIQVISLQEATTTPAMNLFASKWLWLVLLGYAVSMLLLGVAGIMHRQHRQRTRV